MSRVVLWLPLAFVLGGLIGAWGPNEELRRIRERPAKAAAPAARAHGFDAFARMVNIPDVARRGPRAQRRPAETNAVARVRPAASAASSSASNTAARVARPRRLSPEDLRARIDEAAELWRTRSELVRAGALKTLGLNEAGAAAFDAALVQMNDDLRTALQAAADALAEETELTPELGVRLMGDLSAAVAETYDRLGAAVDPARRADVAKLNLAELIDPSVAEPLVAVQGKLTAAERREARP